MSTILRLNLAAGVTGIGLSLLIIMSTPASAQTPAWNLYTDNPSTGQPYVAGPTISFVNGAMSPTTGPAVNLSVGGSPMRTFIMDTGSNGILISQDIFTPPQGSTYLGPGTETLTSSDIVYSGNLYQTNVVIHGGASNNTPVATSSVVVLQVTSTSCTSTVRGCTPSDNPTGITYMGVGFNRGVSTVMPTPDNPNQGAINTNAFINIVSLGTGNSPATNLKQGYIITNSGVTLGLTSAATNDFAFVKLTPQPQPSPNTQGGTVWGQAPVTLTVGTRSGPGTILPDTGIDYAFLTPPAYVGISTCPVNPPGGNNC